MKARRGFAPEVRCLKEERRFLDLSVQHMVLLHGEKAFQKDEFKKAKEKISKIDERLTKITHT